MQNSSVIVIGARGYFPQNQTISGVDTYIRKTVKHFTTKTAILIRHYDGFYLKKNKSIISIPSLKNKYLDTLVYSFLANLSTLFFPDYHTVWINTSGAALFSFLPLLFGKKVLITIHSNEHKREKWPLLWKSGIKVITWIQSKLPVTFIYVSDTINNKKTTPQIVIEPGLEIKKRTSKRLDYILYIGRITEEKRLEWLINYCITHNKKALIAGTFATNSLYAQRIRKRIENSPTIKTVGFVSGNVKRAFIKRAQIIVLPSSLEGNPIVLQEALEYSKKCVIAQDFVGTRLKKCSTIFTFHKDSYSDYVRAMDQALTAPATKTTKKFQRSWKLVAQEYEQLFAQ